MVLMVEDDGDNASAVKIYLEVLGFEVFLAREGAEALAFLELFIPDVILLDLVMPVSDGWTFLDMYNGPVPVVVYSAWSDMKELPKHPYAVLLKPANIRTEVAPVLVEAARSWRN
jgi:CheY-like chemotaxis protein